MGIALITRELFFWPDAWTGKPEPTQVGHGEIGPGSL